MYKELYEETEVHNPCYFLFSFLIIVEVSVTKTTHPCVICTSWCPLLRLLLWLCLRLKALSEHEYFLFLVYFVAVLFQFQEKAAKCPKFQPWTMMSVGKPHLLEESFTTGLMFVFCKSLKRQLLLWSERSETLYLRFTCRRWETSEATDRPRYWRMCIWETRVTHFVLSTWKQYIVRLASILTGNQIRNSSACCTMFFLLCCFYQGL